ncbi:hypothetical protein PS623_00376 [Pseudomonas fluorescens]|nr:hypothetical protein PS623_00376 [Pseudomonas fluorescens]
MNKITNRIRHGRRQQHINLPPSGLGGIGNDQGASPPIREIFNGLGARRKPINFEK